MNIFEPHSFLTDDICSGIQMNNYNYDEAALICNDQGIRDAILILRKVGFSDLLFSI